MAEIKNTFIKAKMNKDLDDRLVPPGEYRNAQNVSISRSEGSDVGALENILGNSVISSTVLNIPNIDVVGFLADNATNYIYLFLSDYTDPYIGGKPTFAPINANCIISKYNTTTPNTPPTKLVEGRFLNFSKNNPIIGVNLLEDLLFWTDNRNQPRKINVRSANPGSVTTPNYYTTEDTISVAKPAPLEAIKLVNIAQGLPLESTMQNPSQRFLPNGSENYYWNEDWSGDPNFLQDKFVRFSYRYKFDDGEYSIIAPFTQVCFIPKQQGYFLDSNQDEAYRSTIVQFVENNVTQIGLNIPFETENPGTNLHITDLEILYKESDGLAIKVVESVPINNVISRMQLNANPKVYDFTYISTKPYKTLPADQTTRVYDTVPVKALAQEISGNRVIYGNFVNRMSPPESIDYGVGYSTKVIASQIEYPNHTAKQNRNYQVGIVLSDKFGRQSSVILSAKDKVPLADTEDNVQYGSSTIYLPYYNGAPSDILVWPGYALRVLFNEAIPNTSDIPGYPGLYSNTNPLGWYSYKMVVRQQEQDYYNVYLPGILQGYPTVTGAAEGIANIVLINDNINKVPRDLSEVGPDQRQYRSSIQLFGRVNTEFVNTSVTLNKQYYPGNQSDTVVSISTVADTNYNLSNGAALVYPEFYQSETNPLIGRISTQQEIGTLGSTPYNITLGVYETSPVVSLLDIYWETSSTGLISELNQAILSGFNGPSFINLNGGYSQNEGMASGTKVVTGAFAENSANIPITTSVNFSVASIIDGNGVNRTNEFTLFQVPPVGGGNSYQFDIATNALFYYGSTSAFDVANRFFTFTINCQDVVGGTTEQLQFTGSVSNIAPSITNCPSTTVSTGVIGSPWTVYTMQGVNGMNAGGNVTQGLVWGLSDIKQNGLLIEDQTLFVIDPVSGVINNPNGTAEAGVTYQFTVSLTDEGGLTSSNCVMFVNTGVAPVQEQIRISASLNSISAEAWEFKWKRANYNDFNMSLVSGEDQNKYVDQPVNGIVTVTIQKVNYGSVLEPTSYQFYVKPEFGNWEPRETITRKPGEDSYVQYSFTNVQPFGEYRVEVNEG